MLSQRNLWPLAAILSFFLHGLAYASLGMASVSSPPAHRKTELSFEVVEKASPAEPPKELQKPETQPQVPKARNLKPITTLPSEPVFRPEAEPPLVAIPATGVTLTATGNDNAFSMPLGTSGALTPEAQPAWDGPTATPFPVRRVPPAFLQPQLVAASDLSTRPSPPALGSALERNYPGEARRRGLGGTAKVRARIDPDGVVRRVALLDESGLGFGSACSRTLVGSRWSPPKDRSGRSVATEIRYTCHFKVQP